MSIRSKFCIIGIPDHQGVLHVGGRVGAVQGPFEFRKIFSKFSGRQGNNERTKDLGDVPDLGGDIEDNHRKAAAFIGKHHSNYVSSVVVGGGHDHGYSHLRGIALAANKKKLARGGKSFKLGCINIDAHLDVRKPAPLITSGSPFYLAIESGTILPKNLIEFGIQSQCNSQPLWEYVEQKKIQVLPFKNLRDGKAVSEFRKCLRKLSASCDAIVVSLDLDSAAMAFSPGVSAPQSEGFTSSEIIAMMEVAGQTKKVISLGIFELNPNHDIENSSARLAATAAFHFLEEKVLCGG